jgi:hypothetical protein
MKKKGFFDGSLNLRLIMNKFFWVHLKGIKRLLLFLCHAIVDFVSVCFSELVENVFTMNSCLVNRVESDGSHESLLFEIFKYRAGALLVPGGCWWPNHVS